MAAPSERAGDCAGKRERLLGVAAAVGCIVAMRRWCVSAVGERVIVLHVNVHGRSLPDISGWC